MHEDIVVDDDVLSSAVGDDGLRPVAGGDGADGLAELAFNSIAIVRIAFFVRVVNGTSRVSLRSKGKIDVSAIAGKFGGGGHFNAAGCTLDMLDVEKAKDLVLKEILEVYK